MPFKSHSPQDSVGLYSSSDYDEKSLENKSKSENPSISPRSSKYSYQVTESPSTSPRRKKIASNPSGSSIHSSDSPSVFHASNSSPHEKRISSTRAEDALTAGEMALPTDSDGVSNSPDKGELGNSSSSSSVRMMSEKNQSISSDGTRHMSADGSGSGSDSGARVTHGNSIPLGKRSGHRTSRSGSGSEGRITHRAAIPLGKRSDYNSSYDSGCDSPRGSMLLGGAGTMLGNNPMMGNPMMKDPMMGNSVMGNPMMGNSVMGGSHGMNAAVPLQRSDSIQDSLPGSHRSHRRRSGSGSSSSSNSDRRQGRHGLSPRITQGHAIPLGKRRSGSSSGSRDGSSRNKRSHLSHHDSYGMNGGIPLNGRASMMGNPMMGSHDMDNAIPLGSNQMMGSQMGNPMMNSHMMGNHDWRAQQHKAQYTAAMLKEDKLKPIDPVKHNWDRKNSRTSEAISACIKAMMGDNSNGHHSQIWGSLVDDNNADSPFSKPPDAGTVATSFWEELVTKYDDMAQEIWDFFNTPGTGANLKRCKKAQPIESNCGKPYMIRNERREAIDHYVSNKVIHGFIKLDKACCGSCGDPRIQYHQPPYDTLPSNIPKNIPE